MAQLDRLGHRRRAIDRTGLHGGNGSLGERDFQTTVDRLQFDFMHLLDGRKGGPELAVDRPEMRIGGEVHGVDVAIHGPGGDSSAYAGEGDGGIDAAYPVQPDAGWNHQPVVDGSIVAVA